MKKRRKRNISPMMKTLVIIECIAVSLLLVLCTYKNGIPDLSDIFQNPKTNVDVVLDAGHGGYDIGAQNGKLYEKDINLQISNSIGKELEANGYRVRYIREDDQVSWSTNEVEDLDYRVKIANRSGAKLFVSIHVNSEEVDMGTYGYEIWGKIKNPTTFALAKNILAEVDSLQYSQNRSIKDQDTSPLHVLEKNNLPAVLMEVGFIYSSNDQIYMRNGEKQEKFSKKIAQGIMKTLKDMKN